MFATLALRSIKCVNSNLRGIWNLRLPHIAGFLGIHDFRLPQPSLIAKDSGRGSGYILLGFASYMEVSSNFIVLRGPGYLASNPLGQEGGRQI
jgi:hypothetical protein